MFTSPRMYVTTVARSQKPLHHSSLLQLTTRAHNPQPSFIHTAAFVATFSELPAQSRYVGTTSFPAAFSSTHALRKVRACAGRMAHGTTAVLEAHPALLPIHGHSEHHLGAGAAAYGEMFLQLDSFKVGCSDDSRCLGDAAVYRVSFGLTVYLALMLLGSVSSSFHRGYWAVKSVLYIGLMVGSFYIPNPVRAVRCDVRSISMTHIT